MKTAVRATSIVDSLDSIKQVPLDKISAEPRVRIIERLEEIEAGPSKLDVAAFQSFI